MDVFPECSGSDMRERIYKVEGIFQNGHFAGIKKEVTEDDVKIGERSLRKYGQNVRINADASKRFLDAVRKTRNFAKKSKKTKKRC